ncbi:MAG: ADP-glyceromanno-heptose 6-epimerase [Micropepsaceae bacterium]
MILVTGGAGFIGSNIAAELAVQNRRVAICDHFGTDAKWKNVAALNPADIVPPQELLWWIERNKGELKAVVHMGAISSTTETDVDLILRENYRLTRNLWEACIASVIPFIYASSAATYGDGTAGFDDDASLSALARLKPLNPYGWSKLLFDKFVAQQVASGAPLPPQYVGLRFFNVYGPNEYHKGSMKSVVAHMYPKAAAGQAVTLFKSHNAAYRDGGQMRDFIYVGDCAAVVAWLLETPSVSGLFNVGSGKARSFLDLASALFKALHREPDIQFVDTPIEIRDKYQYFTQANMNRLRQAGFKPAFTTLEDGVADYVCNYLGAADPYR